ncbi:MAG: fibrobacter succinogenes major paralogous domain-containing protein [Bacteroidota bacterium]
MSCEKVLKEFGELDFGGHYERDNFNTKHILNLIEMKNKYFQFLSTRVSIIIMILFAACSKNNELPVVKTNEVTNIMYNKVTVVGNIISDGGDSIVEKGVCWSIQPNPTISDNSEQSLSNGTTEFAVDINNLGTNVNYYVRSYAINNEGLAYGEELTFTLYLNKPEEPVSDIQNNSYSTVRIGDQVWMKENLKVTHYSNGDAIPYISLQNDSDWLENNSGAYCVFNDDHANTEKYGYLYNGYAVTDERDICPVGWHVPTKEEWQTLVDYLGGLSTAGNLLKSTAHWNNVHPNTTNLSGFSVLPGGLRLHSMPENSYTEYWGVNEQAYFASSDEYTINGTYYIWYVNLMNITEWARVDDNTTKTVGHSIRCIQN